MGNYEESTSKSSKYVSFHQLCTNFSSPPLTPPRCYTVHLDIIKVLLPIDAQENCFKRSIKIYIKTGLTCFGVITIIRERNM
jgi:hypothetical protein